MVIVTYETKTILQNHWGNKAVVRITISLDEELEKKVKELQSMLVLSCGKGFSISKTINILLLGGIISQDNMHVLDWCKIRKFADGREVDLSDLSVEEYLKNIIALRHWV